jgi:hypothetical protein
MIQKLINDLIKLSDLKDEIERKQMLIRMLPPDRKNDKLCYEVLQLKYKFNEEKPWFIRKMKY